MSRRSHRNVGYYYLSPTSLQRGLKPVLVFLTLASNSTRSPRIPPPRRARTKRTAARPRHTTCAPAFRSTGRPVGRQLVSHLSPTMRGRSRAKGFTRSAAVWLAVLHNPLCRRVGKKPVHLLIYPGYNVCSPNTPPGISFHEHSGPRTPTGSGAALAHLRRVFVGPRAAVHIANDFALTRNRQV